jgi:diguanylate cyclase
VAKLVEANRHLQQQLASAETKLQAQSRELETHAAEARTDALTGLANRRAFDHELAMRYGEFRRNGAIFSVAMLDVDHFKRFNDMHGHQAGDEVLRNLAKVFRKHAREIDLVARYGGEEFAIIFPRTTLADAIAAAERIRQMVDQATFHFGKAKLHVNVSVGVAELLSSENGERLVQRSDAALYAAKHAGRNSTHWHDGQAIRPAEEAASLSVPASSEPAIPAGPGEGSVAPQPVTPAAATSALLPARRAAGPSTSPAAENAAESASPPAGWEAKLAAAESRNERPIDVLDRSAFCTELRRRLAQWQRGGPRPALLMVYIDNYPAIVTAHGQEVGNLVLRAMRLFLVAAIREMDVAAYSDTATFVLLLPETGQAGLQNVAERVRQAVGRRMLPLESGPMHLTVSLAGAEAVENDDFQRLLHRTEEALHAARKSGGNCTYFHNGQWMELAETAAVAHAK